MFKDWIVQTVRIWIYRSIAASCNSKSNSSNSNISKYALIGMLVAVWPLTLIIAWLVMCLVLFSFLIVQFYVRSRYQMNSVKLYNVTSGNGNHRLKSILKQCQSVINSFEPWWPTLLLPFGCGTGHLQTLISEFWVRPSGPHHFDSNLYDREVLTTDDEGQFALDYALSPTENDGWWHVHNSCPIVLIVHGFTGGSHSYYVRQHIRVLMNSGNFRCVVLNARGCAGSDLRTPRFFACHDTDDIHTAAQHLRRRWPHAPLFACGFSFGANLLTKYLGEHRQQLISAAVAMSNPFHWPTVKHYLHNRHEEGIEGWVARHVYNYALVRYVMEYVRRHRKVFALQSAHLFDIDELLSDDNIHVDTLHKYDLEITCKLWGFKDCNEYYEFSSCKHKLEHINIPFLNIQAEDDPILSASAIPYADFMINPNIALVSTRVGGHLGWIEGKTIFKPSEISWADRLSCTFLLSVLDHIKVAGDTTVY